MAVDGRPPAVIGSDVRPDGRISTPVRCSEALASLLAAISQITRSEIGMTVRLISTSPTSRHRLALHAADTRRPSWTCPSRRSPRRLATRRTVWGLSRRRGRRSGDAAISMVDSIGGTCGTSLVCPASHRLGLGGHVYVGWEPRDVTDGRTGLADRGVRGAPGQAPRRRLSDARLARRGRRRRPGGVASADYVRGHWGH
jgi:hypothetical protein